MHIVSNIALISINETLFVQLFSFLIFLFIINRLMFRPLKETMDVREHHIDAVKVEIEDAVKQIDQVRIQFEEKESDVRKEAKGIQKKLEDSGNQEASKIFEDIRQEIGTQKEKALKEMESRIEDARQQIKREAEGLSISIIEKVLERRIA